MALKQSPLLMHVHELELRSKDQILTFADLVSVFGKEGHFVLILFLITPFLQPIPLMGLSTPFGLIIAVIALLFYFKKPPYLPNNLKDKKISKETTLKIIKASQYFFKKLEKILKPRLSFMFSQPLGTINIGIIVLNAILMALPLPIPFSNAIPAWVILFQTLGYIERDGVLILISYLQFSLSLIFFSSLVIGAFSAFNYFGQ